VRPWIFRVAVIALAVLASGASAGSYTPPPGDAFPMWSPDGQRIAYLTARGGPALTIRSLDGSEDKRIIDVFGAGPYPDPTSVALSPDWQWLAQIRFANGGLRLLAARVDGTDVRDLAPASYGSRPSWSPDSRRIAFRLPDERLAVIGLEGETPQVIAPAGSSPAWSPDGRRIAYVGGAYTAPDVRIAAADGSTDVVLAGGQGAQHKPSWSPDGMRVAFLTQQTTDQPFVVAVARPDGSDLRTIGSLERGSVEDFLWTPAADAFVVTHSSTFGIFRLDLGTGEERRLTAFGRWPALSRDGTRLAFTGEGECRDRTGIYLARGDGSSARRLTNDCRIFGSPRADVIRGTRLADILVGLGGDDRLLARDPVLVGDTLLGGDGGDVLLGDSRGDILRGGRGDDVLRGGNSQDVLEGGDGHDLLDGQRGLDRIFARDGRRDAVRCGTNVRRHTIERDEVWADRFDRVAADCELVHRAR
jgi:Tol biopolymer transport system component